MGLYNILGFTRQAMVGGILCDIGNQSGVENNIDYTTIRVLKFEFLTKYPLSYNETVLIVA